MVWVFSLPSSEASVVIDAADPAEGKCVESVNDYIEIVGELPLGLILSPVVLPKFGSEPRFEPEPP